MAYITAGQLSRYTGISDRTLRDWFDKGILPKSDDYSILTRAVVAYLQSKIETVRDRPRQAQGDLNEEKTRLTKAQADKVELEIAEREGLLVNADEVCKAWAGYVMACRSRLLALPVRVAYEVAAVNDPNQVQVLIAALVDEALNELASEDFAERLRPTETDGETIQATATVDH